MKVEHALEHAKAARAEGLSGVFAAASQVLAEELLKLRADADRYRWLRNNPTWIGYDADYRPDEVDAVIDAAMLKTPNA